MVPCKLHFVKVFLLLVLIHSSVTDATSVSSSIINATASLTYQSRYSTQSMNVTNATAVLNATATMSVRSSTPGSGGSSVGSPTGNSTGGGGSPTGNLTGGGGSPTGGSPTTGNNTGGGVSPTGGVSFTFPSGWPFFTVPSTQPPTTTPTPEPTTPHPCLSATAPANIDTCGDESCAEKLLNQMELFIKCGKSSDTYYKHSTSLSDMGEKLALRVSAHIKTKLGSNTTVNATVVIVTDQLAVGASTIDSSMYTNISRGMFYFPNISQDGVSDKLGGWVANSILYPKKDLPLRSGRVQVAWSISEARESAVPEEEIEPFRDIVWRLPVSDMKIAKNKITVGKEKPNLAINSPVITFSLQPKPQVPMENPFQIAFRRFKSEGVKNHRCYFWSEKTPSSGFWSSIGSSVIENNDTHTLCAYNHMSIFVVLSEVHPEGDEDARNAVRIVAVVFSVLSIAALVATIRMARKLDCLDNDRVVIHIHLCVVLLIGYFFFIIGAIKSDVKVLNDILPIVLHFCQLSPFVWLCLEAVYFANTLWPLFDYENTNTQKLYASLGWALTAAFAGATAGYDRSHHGEPLASEIVWIFIDKSTRKFFFGPFLALFLVNILVRIGLVAHVFTRPQQNDNDKTSLRIKVNLLTTLVLALVVFLAWFLGVKAVTNTETKGYHYGFIMLYSFQALLVFIIYGWQNEEMWSLHNKRKEEERKSEEKSFGFVYVP